MEGWRCTHENCTHTGKTGQRVQYASHYASWRHEKVSRYHDCGKGCAACERWEGKTTGKAPPSDPLACRHTNGCQRTFSHDCTRCTHELHDVHVNCMRGCERCASGGHSQAAKKRRRKEEEEEEETMGRRKQELAAMKARMAAIHWEKIIIEESKGKGEEAYQRKQAEALLRSIYPQLSFVEAMHALVKGDEATIHHLKANIPEFAGRNK
ncbi:hypothetical protein QOT17_016791 [Balamuthia mandrillaris]